MKSIKVYNTEQMDEVYRLMYEANPRGCNMVCNDNVTIMFFNASERRSITLVKVTQVLTNDDAFDDMIQETIIETWQKAKKDKNDFNRRQCESI